MNGKTRVHSDDEFEALLKRCRESPWRRLTQKMEWRIVHDIPMRLVLKRKTDRKWQAHRTEFLYCMLECGHWIRMQTEWLTPTRRPKRKRCYDCYDEMMESGKQEGKLP